MNAYTKASSNWLEDKKYGLVMQTNTTDLTYDELLKLVTRSKGWLETYPAEIIHVAGMRI